MAGAARKRSTGEPQVVDRKYALSIWGMMVAGVVFVYSASYPFCSRPGSDGVAGNPARLLWGRIEHTMVALALMTIVAALRPEWIRKAAKWGLLFTIVLMCLTFTSRFGAERNGARRWVCVRPTTFEFQPSELAKVAFIAFIAAALARKDEGKETTRKTWRMVAGATGLMVAILMAQRDQGMATIFIVIALVMAYLAGASKKWLAGLSVGLFLAGLGWAMCEAYRWKRITAFLNPEGDMQDTSYHVIRMLVAVARGGIMGEGLAFSEDKWHSLSWPFTDSVFSVIAGELGLVGGMIVLGAIAYLTWRAMDIGRRSYSIYGWYLAAGAAVALGLQAVLHVAVNTSMVPCTGLTLPFISYGGSSLVSAAMLAGMVLSVSRYARPEVRRPG
jgi:cell division protein FtsW